MKNRLKEIRESLGLTQRDLAKELSYSKQAVSHIETGKRKLSYETALKIEELYGISAEYSMGRDVPPEISENVLTKSECEFLKLLKKLSESDRFYIKSLMEELSTHNK